MLILIKRLNIGISILGHKYTEVVNDLNGELINLHRIIQTNPQSLSLELQRMLTSREIFDGIKKAKLKFLW